MWYRIANLVLRFRVFLLILLAAITAFMGYQATKVKMSYDFTNAVPTDNPKYQDYQTFLKMFGGDGNTIMIGIQSEKLFDTDVFKDYIFLSNSLANLEEVENVLGIPNALKIEKDSIATIAAKNVFPDADEINDQNIDSLRNLFFQLPFYNNLLYNAETKAFLMAVRVNKEILTSKKRTKVINDIVAAGDKFGNKHGIEMHYSGLPHIRTQMANKTEFEVKLFLILSFVLTAIILFAFFRSFIAVLTSMIVVAIGVIWSFGTLALFNYNITILTGVIPSLIVVIGIPNCVYFLNKYHSEYALQGKKLPALKSMTEKMGIVTLFTNLTAAIGFGVFFFTKSVILKEFGLVAGLNIMALFFISLIVIPAVYSFLPPPKSRHTGYLESKWINKILDSIALLVFDNRKKLYLITFCICSVAVIGIFRLKAVGHIVDDLPKSNKIYTDIKFFERNFKGVMPLEIIIDTKKKYGSVTSLSTWEKIDEFTQMLEQRPEIGAGLTLVKGVKFARQGFSGGDSSEYRLPDQFEFSALRPFLVSSLRKMNTSNDTSALSNLLLSFVDSSARYVRISVNIADIGSEKMPQLLDEITPIAENIFDKEDYELTFTGASITFLEGSKFIINSLKESLLLAFGMILICMVILFQSWRIVLIAIITNIVPLIITAGIMGWANIPLKPSTVLVFSVALGITVDVTIRFLVNFKQDLAGNNKDIQLTVRKSIHDTGLSIIFTSLVLTVGFGVFAVSDFDGTKMLGYLTALTLIVAMVANLTLQPALLLWMDKAKKKKSRKKMDMVP